MPMLRHNFVITYRTFLRYKGSFLINLIGLSTGLTSALLIYLWVNDELRFDKFHQNDERLYQVMVHRGDDKGISTFEGVSGLLFDEIINTIPDVEKLTVSSNVAETVVSVDQYSTTAKGQFVSSDFFNVFTYPLIEGNKDQVLNDKMNIVLSTSLAKRLFRTVENAMGKFVDWDLNGVKTPFLVTGVFQDVPANSSEQFDFIMSFNLFHDELVQHKFWGNYYARIAVVLKEEAAAESVGHKIDALLKSKMEKNAKVTAFLKPFSDKYLFGRYENGEQSGGRIVYVRLFIILAIFILLIACINFMNLSTARASRRIKEVGMKKTIGVRRNTLVFQYLSESLFMSFLSIIFAILLVILCLPKFNEITGKSLGFADFDASFILAVLAIATITGLIAGSYPAIYLSGLNPITLLTRNYRTSLGELVARKGLVLFQFAVSIILIVSVLVVYKQVKFIHTKNLGYTKDNIILFQSHGQLKESVQTFLYSLKNIPGVVNASSFNSDLKGNNNKTDGIVWEGKQTDDKTKFGQLDVNYNFVETLGMEIEEGRAFSEDSPSDTSKILFNEIAIEYMGLKDPIGKTVKKGKWEFQIAGVVKNFHFESLYEPLKPCFMILAKDGSNILVKIKEGMESETIDRIQKVYQDNIAGLPFAYKFLEDDYQELYASENKVVGLLKFFSGVAIVISCLGLFGLATFTAERRVKEFGIRKVLGSTEFEMIYLLSNDFTKIVFASVVFALPLSYLITKSWLNNFAYKIELESWYFVGAGLVVLFIAWLIVAMQAIKVAKMNPTNCLRNE